jgi:Lysine methyltransferase
MWPSAAALSQWISTNPTIIEESSHILELGAGCGLVGIAAACIRETCQKSYDCSSPKCSDPQIVTLTDFNPRVLRNLERNVALNGVSEHCRVLGLDFNDQSQVSQHGGWADMNGHHLPVRGRLRRSFVDKECASSGRKSCGCLRGLDGSVWSGSLPTIVPKARSASGYDPRENVTHR